jgi:hypothetical protein
MAVVGSLQASAFIGWRNPALWAAFAALPLAAPLQLYLLNGTLAAAKARRGLCIGRQRLPKYR